MFTNWKKVAQQHCPVDPWSHGEFGLVEGGHTTWILVSTSSCTSRLWTSWGQGLYLNIHMSPCPTEYLADSGPSMHMCLLNEWMNKWTEILMIWEAFMWNGKHWTSDLKTCDQVLVLTWTSWVASPQVNELSLSLCPHLSKWDKNIFVVPILRGCYIKWSNIYRWT